MRAYSMDLRERVLLESDAGLSAAAVATKYHVSASWVRRLKQRRRETGEIAPRAQRYGPRPVLAPHLVTLAALIAEQPDRTLADLQAALPTPASLATIWRAVTKLGFTLKKNGARLRTGPTGRRGRPPASGRRRPPPWTRPTSSFLTKPGWPPTCCDGMGAAPAASGCPTTRPTDTGRPARSSPASASPGSRPLACSTGPWTAPASSPMSSRSSSPRCSPATS